MESGYSVAQEKQESEGEQHCLHGHVYALRRFGSLLFIVLRNRHGLTQIVVDNPELLKIAETLSCETPIKVTGLLRPQPKQPTASELHASKLELLAHGEGTLPLEISREKRMKSLSLNTLLEYRPLTLRNEKVRAVFKIEAEFCKSFREFLGKEGFTEIHSPKIVATGTEGGAALFNLDYFGSTAYLAQSPQFYKQIMVGVFERVFEIGSVYRAEEHSTVRHLNEYISMDFEMGFIKNEQELLDLQTKLLQHMFASLAENCRQELALLEVRLPQFEIIPQLKLEEAVRILQDKLGWKGDGEDLDPEAERLISEYMQRQESSELLYLTHYPCQLRPFYALPEKSTNKSHSFDLLFRGLEITTGGQRIHEYEELCQSIKNRGMESGEFADYLQCFKYGMPPHGGLAIGLERLAKQLLGLKNVRQASLFPRDQTRLSP